MTAEKNIQLPPSVVGWFDALVALPVILGIFFALRRVPHEILGDALFVIVLIAALGIVMGAIEIYRAPWRKAPAVKRAWTHIIGQASIKLLGFFAAAACILALYWLFPEYQRAYYDRYFEALLMVLPIFPLLALPYFVYVEYRLPSERDGAWQAAQFVLGKWRAIDWHTLSQYALGWLVKGYFLPIMFGDVANNMIALRGANWNLFEIGFVPAFELLFLATINLELIFVSAGYVFTCRLFDSHIRAVEKTLFGWVIALISYGPFLGLFYGRYFAYNSDGLVWLDWFKDMPYLVVVWGSIILVLLVLHLWSDACFGLRFSNLTNRGIITNGPYRFSKHPAYVIKNIRWWMVAVPFLAAQPLEALRLSLLLVCVNIVYTLRSYAEERMLSQDPTYRAYALWMEEHGMLRFLGKRFPIFSYSWRLRRWQERGVVPAT